MKKETKNKVGRPKLADSKLKKENIDVIGKMFKNFIKNKEEE